MDKETHHSPWLPC